MSNVTNNTIRGYGYSGTPRLDNIKLDVKEVDFVNSGVNISLLFLDKFYLKPEVEKLCVQRLEGRINIAIKEKGTVKESKDFPVKNLTHIFALGEQRDIFNVDFVNGLECVKGDILEVLDEKKLIIKRADRIEITDSGERKLEVHHKNGQKDMFDDDYGMGSGKSFYPNGDVEVCAWMNGKKEGSATTDCPNGERIVCNYVNGAKHGQANLWKHEKICVVFYYNMGKIATEKPAKLIFNSKCVATFPIKQEGNSEDYTFCYEQMKSEEGWNVNYDLGTKNLSIDKS